MQTRSGFCFVYFFYDLFCMDSTGIVAEMCIGDEHDFQGIEFAGGFINSNFIRRYINVFGMIDAADTDQQNTKDADRSGNRKRNT